MAGTTEFFIQVLFQKDTDGRVRVRSPQLAGLHLAGKDLDTILADLNPIVKDLLYHNSNFIADEIRWVPSLEEALRPMRDSVIPHAPHPEKESLLVITARAA